MNNPTIEPITWEDFAKIDICTGTIVAAEVFAEARKPAYKIKVDFGGSGIRTTSAQVTRRYSPEELIGKQVVGVLNFPPKRIAGLKSEFLLLGAINQDEVTLLTPDKPVENGLKIG